MTLKSINPFTGQVLEEFEPLTDDLINKAIEDAASAFTDWRRTKFDERKNRMLKAADILKGESQRLGRIISEEMGKPVVESRAEIEKCAWVCQHYANDAKVLLHREAVAAGAHSAFVQYEPLGVILGIMPWNFPFWQVFRFVAPTLMAGNVILLKHASNVQRCARAIQEVLHSAGFTNGIFQNLPIGSDKVKLVIEHDAVKAVTLTGSESAGSKVASQAGSKIKKTVLELGGSNSFIVLDDAQMDKAVETGIKARMQNGGQSCIAAKRFILHEKISDKFIEMYREKIAGLEPGDPLDENTKLGPLSSLDQANKVSEQVKKSVELGATVIMGNYPDDARFPPMLVINVKPGMPLFDEEVFGPVTSFIIAKDENEAISLSNKSRFGLGVSLFTNNLEKAEKLIPEFDDGAVFVNDLVKSDPRLPFGGTKKSGYGRELSVNGIREFVNIKTVYIQKFDDVKDDHEKNTAISMGSPNQ